MGSAVNLTGSRFAGRVAEQRRLAEVLSASAEGLPAAVLVHGEAGVGKTRLVREVTQEYQAAGHEVLWGTSVRFGAASVPFAPVVQALDHWALQVDPAVRSTVLGGSDELSTLLPSLGMGSPEVAPGRLLPIVDRVVQRIVAMEPTVLVVDDLQWADVSSLDLLAYLIAGFRGQNLALILTIREEERPLGHPLRGWLADVRRLQGVSELTLSRLDLDETTQQIAHLLGRPPTEELVVDVLQRSGGNAYFTELLVRDLPEDAQRLPSRLPNALREALLARWHSLSEPARTLTRLLAVGGRPTTYDTLCTVTEDVVLVDDVPGLLREAVDGGVAQQVGDQEYWFRHPLLAEVLLATLTAQELAPAHAAYARALEARVASRPDLTGGLSADLAVHHECAGQFDQAFVFSIRAADFAQKLHASTVEAAQLTRACALWERVREEVGGSTEDRIALLLRTSRAGEQAGVLESTDLLDQALSLVDRMSQPLLASTLLTEWTYNAWLHDPAGQHLRPELLEAIQLTEPFPDSPERAFALAGLVGAQLWDRRTPEMPAQSWGQVQEAVEVAERSGSMAAMARALCCRAEYLGDDHRGLESLADAERSYLMARQTGQVATMELAARRGELAVAQQHLDRALELVPIYFIGLGGRETLLQLLVARGESEQALGLFRPLLTEHLSYGVDRDTDEMLLWGARAAADLAEQVRDRRDPEGEEEATHLPDQFFAQVAATPLARPGLSAEDDPIWSAYRAVVAAETGRCRGSADQAVAWGQAAAGCQAIGFRWLEAMTQWRWAQALLSEGAVKSAVAEPLRLAHRTALEMGAAPLVKSTGQLASIARIRLDEPGGSRSEKRQADVPEALAALTPREREVLATWSLVARTPRLPETSSSVTRP
jgi:hypothetical protein